MIDVYVTHYVNDELVGYNDIAIDTLMRLREVAAIDGWDLGRDYRLTLIYYSDSAECIDDLLDRVPWWVTLVQSQSRVQPHLMNLATRCAKENGSEYFVCIHNDVRPARRWLQNIVADVREGEGRYGRGNVIATPRYVPFHWAEPYPEAHKHAAFWNRIRPEVEAKMLSPEVMLNWCVKHSIPFERERGLVIGPERSSLTDDGHMLMMYCAAPEFFDQIGGCDESFIGLNYGDCDWGIRALMAGKKNMISQGALLGHLTGLTFFNPTIIDKLDSNDHRFMAKWGMETWDALQNGSVWTRLHKEQPR